MALQGVVEAQHAVRQPQPDRGGALVVVVNAVPVDSAHGVEVAAAAAAFEGVAGLEQPAQRLRIDPAALALAQHRPIRRHSEPVQGPELAFSRAGNFPRRIQVFDAHQPVAAGAARHQPAAQGRDQRAEVQGTGGRGRETAAGAGIWVHVDLNLTGAAYI